jgi:hypothetical protein
VNTEPQDAIPADQTPAAPAAPSKTQQRIAQGRWNLFRTGARNFRLMISEDGTELWERSLLNARPHYPAKGARARAEDGGRRLVVVGPTFELSIEVPSVIRKRTHAFVAEFNTWQKSGQPGPAVY